jgi:putative transposase
VREVRDEVEHAVGQDQGIRLIRLLDALGVPRSSWYRRPVPEEQRKPPGPPPKPIPEEVVRWVVAMAVENPWYGYRRIAVMCRRAGQRVNTRQAYRVMKQFGLLHRRVCRKAELHQAAKLFELLPNGPNELWQMDVTYVHIPGFGWWYAITVIDYYSRYLLACHLTWSYSAAEGERALSLAREEAERLCGPLGKRPFLVTDNGPTFVARRFRAYLKGAFTHVRIAYRTPTQLGLLERFHRTLKEEELYWRLYDSPEHCRGCLAEFRQRYNGRRPHWALVPEAGGDPVTPEEVYVGGVRTRIPKWQGWARAAKAKLDEMMEQAA